MTHIFPETDIASTANVAESAIIGKPYRPLLGGAPVPDFGATYIRSGASVGEYTIVGKGCEIGEDSILDDFSRVEAGVRIGRRCLVLYGAQICASSVIGSDCIVGGFVGERTTVGNHCRLFGQIVHKQDDPSLGWDEDSSEELAAQIEEFCFVGFRALLIGHVRVGPYAYVVAGATVTKDVPQGTVVTEHNVHTPIEQWKGRLKES